MIKVAILGSTGSIGTQTLNVISSNSDKLCVHSLVAFSNSQLLQQQCSQYGCNNSFLIARDGQSCLINAVVGCDVAVIATRGIIALEAVLYCIAHDIDVAIANKEVLVTAGMLVKQAMITSKSKLLPVDSEHSAIWQCIADSNNKIDKIHLTASGGALYNMHGEQLYNATADMALQHPNWSMGNKITIDSATMMNKALEVVEACWLFGVDAEDIDILVHRQSVVHSMVQFEDGCVMAQLSYPDMQLPIQYALLQGQRCQCNTNKLNIAQLNNMTFEQCPVDKFPCSNLAKLMLDKDAPLIATVINGINDVCVDYYLQGKIVFGQIYDIIMHMYNSMYNNVLQQPVTIDNIKYFDSMAKQKTTNYIMEITC